MGYTYVPANPAWDWVVANMGTVPVVALGLGSVAGLGAARLVTSHYSVMVEGISHMFIAGPPVVARAGQTVTKDELGGSDIHARSGAVDDVVASEAEAFARARRFLSYLPSSVYELPERIAPADDPARREPWLIEAVPQDRRKVYDMRRILQRAWSTRTRCSRWAASSAARSSPRWRGSTAGRSRCWRAIPTSTAAAGPRRPRRRSRASSISPTRFICPSCIWSTCRAS